MPSPFRVICNLAASAHSLNQLRYSSKSHIVNESAARTTFPGKGQYLLCSIHTLKSSRLKRCQVFSLYSRVYVWSVGERIGTRMGPLQRKVTNSNVAITCNTNKIYAHHSSVDFCCCCYCFLVMLTKLMRLLLIK